ncbi:helix-turn-helix domain-containing protein [Streptomyces sp. A5-4]|uniref:helix-turn-helix domain-containing protein n=1 Tax=Streptomyces sp. A5-4 TaxID=3384771 RepID=UPI003DA839FA
MPRPLQYLLRARLQESRRLLRETDTPVEHIADRVGFTSPAALRHHFRTLTDTTPSAYRRAQRAAGGDRCAQGDGGGAGPGRGGRTK